MFKITWSRDGNNLVGQSDANKIKKSDGSPMSNWWYELEPCEDGCITFVNGETIRAAYWVVHIFYREYLIRSEGIFDPVSERTAKKRARDLIDHVLHDLLWELSYDELGKTTILGGE